MRAVWKDHGSTEVIKTYWTSHQIVQLLKQLYKKQKQLSVKTVIRFAPNHYFNRQNHIISAGYSCEHFTARMQSDVASYIRYIKFK